MAVNVDKLRNSQVAGLTVGVVPEDGNTKLRLELDDFIQDADVANLYFLALIELMKPGVWEDPFSWFQIAGVYAWRGCLYTWVLIFDQVYTASPMSPGME